MLLENNWIEQQHSLNKDKTILEVAGRLVLRRPSASSSAALNGGAIKMLQTVASLPKA